MVECAQIYSTIHFPSEVPLNNKTSPLLVGGAACFRQLIMSPEPQWGVYRPAYGVVIPAVAVPKGRVQIGKHTASVSTKPMSRETKSFIQRVIVPILVARYIAELKRKQEAANASVVPL